MGEGGSRELIVPTSQRVLDDCVRQPEKPLRALWHRTDSKHFPRGCFFLPSPLYNFFVTRYKHKNAQINLPLKIIHGTYFSICSYQFFQILAPFFQLLRNNEMKNEGRETPLTKFRESNKFPLLFRIPLVYMTTLTDHAKEKKYMTLSLDTALPHDKEDSTVLLHYIPYHHLYN